MKIMIRSEFFKLNQDYQSDYNFTSVAIKSNLLGYQICIEINSKLQFNLHKIEDIKFTNNSENTVAFPFFISNENISGISIYLIPNAGKEINNENQESQLSLFEDTSPRVFSLFGAKTSSIFAIKDLRPDYYLIIKHPQKNIDLQKWNKSLKDIPNIQPISVQSSEYIKHHNMLLTEIELHLNRYESLMKVDSKRKKEMLKKKMYEVRNSSVKNDYSKYR